MENDEVNDRHKSIKTDIDKFLINFSKTHQSVINLYSKSNSSFRFPIVISYHFPKSEILTKADWIMNEKLDNRDSIKNRL